jgi:hypothetical protein
VPEPGRRGSDPPYFLRADGPALELSVGHWLSVDVYEFDRCLDEAEKADGEGATSLALPATSAPSPSTGETSARASPMRTGLRSNATGCGCAT